MKRIGGSSGGGRTWGDSQRRGKSAEDAAGAEAVHAPTYSAEFESAERDSRLDLVVAAGNAFLRAVVDQLNATRGWKAARANTLFSGKAHGRYLDPSVGDQNRGLHENRGEDKVRSVC
jgi:hypothetical protein